MKFTEADMTVAVDAVAKRLFRATRPPWRRGRADAAWQALGAVEKYNRRSAVGEMILPVLQSLPEHPASGAPRRFSAQEYAEAAEAATRSRFEHRSAGSWSAMSRGRRKRMVRTVAALTRLAVTSMPQDPDGLTVPDHL